MQIARFRLPFVLVVLLAWLVGCEADSFQVREPAAKMYLEAEIQEDQGLFAEAATQFEQVIKEYSGTRIANFAYLRLAELRFRQEEWVEAETNYKLFLTLIPNGHLTSYVLYKLLQVNYQRGFTGLIFKAREVERDMEPNRQSILNYKRFFLLHPNSVYFPETVPLYAAARESLARYELLVGDFYMERGQFNAAAQRYYYLLRHYPEFPTAGLVLDKLIEAYRKNQQPNLASEMEQIRQARIAENEQPQSAAAGP